jgi:hypothetical protein
MNNLEQKLLSYVGIGRDHWDVPVRVELRAYLDFTRRINMQLRKLVNHWEKKSSPASKRLRRPNRPR